MDSTNLRSRRLFLISSSVLVCAGCSTIPFAAGGKSTPLTPRQTLDTYFSYLGSSRYTDAERMMTTAFRERLGQEGMSALLHSVRSARVTEAVDAVEWANRLGARLPAPPADRREFLVTLEISPSPEGARSWSAGTNRRFIDLVRQNGSWKIDAIGVSPGILVTGEPVRADNQVAVVLPVAPLRLGPAPIDRAIYTARQNAVDRGAIAWATDPIEVVHHDGPSFGLNPDDPAQIVRRDADPASLVPRVLVQVRQGDSQYLVTLIQPIRSGEGGIWAIAEVEAYGSIPP